MADFEPRTNLSGYDRVVVWLRNHGLSVGQVADLLTTSTVHVRQLDFRGRRRFASFEILPPQLVIDTGTSMPRPGELRLFLGIRDEKDSVELTPRKRRRLRDVAAEIEAVGVTFWSGVRFEACARKLAALFPEFGNPAHSGWFRLRARVHELRAEMHLHFGKSLSALGEGLRAYHLYRMAYHETDLPAEKTTDLECISRVTRLLSQMLLFRREEALARRYLGLHKAAQEQLGRAPRPEYHHQLATLAFQANTEDADRQARSELKKAMESLERTADYGRPKMPHEVDDIGLRHMYLLRHPNWEKSRELLHDQLRKYPTGDIHIPLNVAMTAACGLSIDVGNIQQDALHLLNQHEEAARGYLRSESSFRLLRLTPQLPKDLRLAWTRFALYENTADEKKSPPRYKIRYGCSRMKP